MTTYDLVPATDYADRTVQGNLDIAQSTSLNVRELTTGVFTVDSDIVLLCDASGGNVILNLPQIVNAPRKFYIIKKTNLTNLVTLTATGGNTINGSFTFDLATNVTVEIINAPGNNDWKILTNLSATTSPTDSGVTTRELLSANGGGQNPSLGVTTTEVDIQSPASGTLADGVLGQLKEMLIVNVVTPGDTYIVTITNSAGQNTITFDTVGQSLSMRYTAFGWTFTTSGAVMS